MTGIDSDQPKRILIIDDEEMIRESLSMILELNGYRVDSTGEGLAAIEMIRTTAYSLLLLDLNMPGFSGIEVLRELNRIRCRVPIVVFTGFGSPASEQTCTKLGASAFLGKPVPIPELLERVRKLTSSA